MRLLIVALLLLAVAPATAEAAPCDVRGSRTVAKSADARIYKRKVTDRFGDRHWRTYGCLRATGRSRALDNPANDSETTRFSRPFKLVGPHIAYAVERSDCCDPPPGGADYSYMAVRDLRAGRTAEACEAHGAWCPTQQRERIFTDLVLTPSGSAAWIVHGKVFALPASASALTVLDDQPGVDERSLAIPEPGRVRWLRGGAERSAPLP